MKRSFQHMPVHSSEEHVEIHQYPRELFLNSDPLSLVRATFLSFQAFERAFRTHSRRIPLGSPRRRGRSTWISSRCHSGRSQPGPATWHPLCIERRPLQREISNDYFSFSRIPLLCISPGRGRRDSWAVGCTILSSVSGASFWLPHFVYVHVRNWSIVKASGLIRGILWKRGSFVFVILRLVPCCATTTYMVLLHMIASRTVYTCGQRVVKFERDL